MNEAQAQNLEGRIAKAEEILEGVRDELSKAKEQPAKRWEPEQKEKYLFMISTGDTDSTSNTIDPDKERIKLGNCFPLDSEDKLAHHVRRIKLMNELFQVALAIDGEKAGVFEVDKNNYALCADQKECKWSHMKHYYNNPGLVYFSTTEKALQAWDMISQESRDFLMGK